jgi:hypothetical protein
MGRWFGDLYHFTQISVNASHKDVEDVPIRLEVAYFDAQERHRVELVVGYSSFVVVVVGVER